MHVTAFFVWVEGGVVTRCRTLIMYNINFHYGKDNWTAGMSCFVHIL